MAIHGVDPSFGINEFNEAKYQSKTETIANTILTLLFGKPGFFPSMPELGIDIQKTIYMFWDDIDPEFIKAEIVSQCKNLKEYVNDGSLDVIKTSYLNNPLLLVIIPVQIENSAENLAIGITKDDKGNIKYNYVFEKVGK